MEKNYNSITNQEIKSKFIEREVLFCFSYPMEALLNAGVSNNNLPQYEDIENLYVSTCQECGYQGKFEIVGKDNNDEENFGENVYLCPNCRKETDEEPETEEVEIYEYWLVTEYLYNKLKEKNEVVIEWENLFIWGRSITGQAILLDDVISKICEEMEILEGQKYSWSK